MLTAGHTIADRYVLRARIAAGGAGEVWRARDSRLERDVAVKLLRPEHADDEGFRQRLRHEAQSAGALHCDCVVNVYDWGEQTDDAGRWSSYIVMELVEGDTVAGLLARSGRLDDTRVAQVIADTACGLAAAHGRGLVHRDIKPANLLVTTAGRVKVADFGIARAADGLALTQTGTLLGTPTYLSPEQVTGHSATPASDIYSLGIVAYQCLAGSAPFHGDGDIATATARLGASPPPLPDSVPARSRDLVLAMLDRDPARRPTADQVAAALTEPAPTSAATQLLPTESVLATQPMPTQPMPSGQPTLVAATAVLRDRLRQQPTGGGSRRQPAILASAAGLILVAAVASVLALTGGHADPQDKSPSTTRHPHATSSPTTGTTPAAKHQRATTTAVTTQAATPGGPGPQPPGAAKQPGPGNGPVPPGQAKKHGPGHGHGHGGGNDHGGHGED